MDGPRGYYAKQAGQRKTNTIVLHIYVVHKNKSTKLMNTENRQVGTQGEGISGVGGLGEGDQEVQMSSYKINESCRCIAW